MVKIAEILSRVERIKEGHSESHTPSEWKETFEKRRASQRLEETPSPIRQELGKLQDNGLGQKQPEFPKAEIIGKP